MSNYKHKLLLIACGSNQASESEKNKLSYAAGMWATGERKITHAEVRLANEILSRNEHPTEWWKERPMQDGWGSDDAEAGYITEVADPKIHGIDKIIMVVTSGQNKGRRFVIQETPKGIVRGHRVFKSIAAAAGGFARK